jgi:hypothetical protein
MDSITLKYNTSLTCQIPIDKEKGLTRPEKFNLWPEVVNKCSDGSTGTQFKAFIRSIYLRTEVLTDAQILAYLYWCLDNNRLVDYTINGISESNLILVPQPQQELQRYDDFEGNPYLEINFDEGIARTAFPV